MCDCINTFDTCTFENIYKNEEMELAWRCGSVMDCHATARGSIPYGNGEKKRALHPSQGTVHGMPSLK